jgi:hypothetical protein
MKLRKAVGTPSLVNLFPATSTPGVNLYKTRSEHNQSLCPQNSPSKTDVAVGSDGP